LTNPPQSNYSSRLHTLNTKTSMTEKTLLSTREVAKFLKVNEKSVYSLIAEKGLPATKVTGKWAFPMHLVIQWVENSTVNYPNPQSAPPHSPGLLIICGSNDILLEQTLALFNARNKEHIAVFGNLGSMGGIRALEQNKCHMATSHLLQEEDEEYNFDFAGKELGRLPAVVNFCRREQGLLVAKNNPLNITSIKDLSHPDIRLANRPLGTGTRLLLDRELIQAGLTGEKIKGYKREFAKHLDAGLEVLAGRADVAPCIRAVAGILDLDFIPLRWERFDLLIRKEIFFEPKVQLFMGILREPDFHKLATQFEGYDLSICSRMVFPKDTPLNPKKRNT